VRTLDRTCRIALLLASLLLPPGDLCAQSQPDVPPSNLYSQNKSSVVTILTFDANKAPLAQGSGFIVAPNRIVTNYHVIEGSSKVSVVFDDGTTVSVDSLAAGSREKDLAILPVATGTRLPLKLGNELDAKVGETVYAIGSPHGLSASLSNGLVSAFREEEGQFRIQVTGSISPGSSGGPLFNTHGQVIGITTERLKDGSFGFAIAATDIRHLLLVPPSTPVKLADMIAKRESPSVRPGKEGPAPGPKIESHSAALDSVQGLYDRHQYADAASSFKQLRADVRHSFDGELLLCKIQMTSGNSVRGACDAAIALRPDDGVAYGYKAMGELYLSHQAKAEELATRAVRLSPDTYTRTILAYVYYAEEKYSLVASEISDDQYNAAALTLLEGAALHLGDTEKYLRLETKLKSFGSSDDPWRNYRDGMNAVKQGKWVEAEEAFRKCDLVTGFMDPACAIALADIELTQGESYRAKKDINEAIGRYFRTNPLINEAILIHLVLGDKTRAMEIHTQFSEMPGRRPASECLYYYGTDQPARAYDHCVAVTSSDGKSFKAWSRAGYTALDLGRYQLALNDLARASTLFLAEDKALHTESDTMEILWGVLLANYVNGQKNDAKGMDDIIRKQYPKFSTISGLEKLPLVLSTQTRALIAKAIADLR